MIVRNPIDEMDGAECFELIERGGYHGGSISPWMEAPESNPARRPIGFRWQEPEPEEPTSPEGMLL